MSFLTDYVTLKTLHVIGAVLMVGNVTVTGFWAAYLWRHQRDVVAFRPVARAILWTDLVFTFGGGSVLTMTGIQMIRVTGMDWVNTRWLLWGIVMLAVSSFLWLVVLIPDQLRMEKALEHETGRIRTLFLRWSWVGWFSTVLLFVAMWWMVHKG